MDAVGQLDRELLRTRLLLLAALMALAALAAALWRVQVVHTSRYRSSLDRQSMRRVRLPGARGAIFDRHGVCLANNRPSYSLALYLEELRQPGRMSNTLNAAERAIDGLAAALKLERTVTREALALHLRRRCLLPLLVWEDLDDRALARWAESGQAFTGADVYVEPMRVYPQGTLAAHVIGYVGRLEPDFGAFYHFYLPEMEGRAGVELALNETLSGVAGGRLVRVDALGFKHEELGERAPIAGEDVVLTLDIRVQRYLEEALAGRRGAAVVIDPRNGDLLGLASAPAFDPKDIRSPVELSRLTNDEENRPLFNRAVQGLYPPGSTFKPLVALAALQSGRSTARTEFECPGYFEIGDLVIRCWNRYGHGPIGLTQAIEQSCNVYFCQIGLQCGEQGIGALARAAGLGAATGVELVGEAAGLVPDEGWKRRIWGEGWRKGDTCNLSIGQGALLATPLQMAVVAAALANGGDVYRPRLVRRGARRPEGPFVYEPPPEAVDDAQAALPVERGELLRRLPVSSEALAAVREGMREVVESYRGTGKGARVAGVPMGGKTGSAEYGPRAARRKHAWMIAFAPFEAPRYAIALVVEDGVSGGVTAAPRVGYVMARIFGQPADLKKLDEAAAGAHEVGD